MKKRLRKKLRRGEYDWQSFFRTRNEDELFEDFLAAGLAAGLKPIDGYTR